MKGKWSVLGDEMDRLLNVVNVICVFMSAFHSKLHAQMSIRPAMSLSSREILENEKMACTEFKDCMWLKHSYCIVYPYNSQRPTQHTYVERLTPAIVWVLRVRIGFASITMNIK